MIPASDCCVAARIASASQSEVVEGSWLAKLTAFVVAVSMLASSVWMVSAPRRPVETWYEFTSSATVCEAFPICWMAETKLATVPDGAGQSAAMVLATSARKTNDRLLVINESRPKVSNSTNLDQTMANPPASAADYIEAVIPTLRRY